MAPTKAVAKADMPEEEAGVAVEYAPVPKPANDPDTSNLRLWRDLFAVPSNRLKEFQRSGGFKGHDINPTWRMERMTEVFGPVGWGWNYEIMERWRESFGIKKRKDAPREDVENVFVRLRVWYVLPEEKPVWRKDPETGAFDRTKPPMNALFTGEQIGGTEIERGADETWKMAITDALGKCMVQIGLAASIYLGQWDDSKYRGDQLRAEASKRAQEFLDELQEVLPKMEALPEMNLYTSLDSFKWRVQEARDNDWKLSKRIDEVIFEHNTRLAEDFRDNLDAFLSGVATPDEFEAGIGPFRHAVKFIMSDKVQAKILKDVAEFKKRFESHTEEPKQIPQSPPPAQGKAAQAPAAGPAKPISLPAIEVTFDEGGKERWGAFTKGVIESIKSAVENGIHADALKVFIELHRPNIEKMREAGGAYVGYAERIDSDADAALKILGE